MVSNLFVSNWVVKGGMENLFALTKVVKACGQSFWGLFVGSRNIFTENVLIALMEDVLFILVMCVFFVSIFVASALRSASILFRKIKSHC